MVKEKIYLSYHNGTTWETAKLYYCSALNKDMPKVLKDSGMTQGGVAYQQVTSYRNSYTANLIINNSSLYSNDYTTFWLFLKNFYKTHRQRISFDNVTFTEIVTNEADVLGFEYLENTKYLNSIALSFIDKYQMTGDFT